MTASNAFSTAPNPQIPRTPPSDRLASLHVLALDVDGVLTDGSITYSDSGEEIKTFNVKDGLGIRLLLEAGIPVALITGRRSRALRHRCENLGISLVYDGIDDKKSVLARLCAETGAAPESIAFVGDDLPDLAMKEAVGLFVAVADAHEALREKADWVTAAGGGKGAVREVCEAILKAKGLWLKNRWLSS